MTSEDEDRHFRDLDLQTLTDFRSALIKGNKQETKEAAVRLIKTLINYI